MHCTESSNSATSEKRCKGFELFENDRFVCAERMCHCKNCNSSIHFPIIECINLFLLHCSKSFNILYWTYTIIIILHFTLFIFINSMNKTVTISVLICVARRKDIFHFIAKLNKLYCLQKVWKGFWAVSLNFFQPYLQTTMKAESFVLGFSHEINLDC